MNTLQLIIVIIGAIVVLFFFVATLLPAEKKLERSILINRPAAAIYSLVSDFHNYKKWNPWSHKDPEARDEITGKPNEVGHSWSWNGKVIGSGELKIKKLDPHKYIISDLIFHSPRKMEAEDCWRFEPFGENKTKVIWGHKSKLKFPTERYLGLFLARMLDPYFEKGLQNLKQFSES